MREALALLGDHPQPETVTLVCFDPLALRVWRAALVLALHAGE